jgi:hypothetical protein
MAMYLIQVLPIGMPDNSLPPGIGGGPIIPPGTPPGIWGGPGSLPPGIWGGAGGLPPGIGGGPVIPPGTPGFPGQLPAPGAGQLPVFPPPGATPHTAVAGAPPASVDAQNGAWVLVNIGSGLVWCWAQAPGKPDHALPPGSPGTPEHPIATPPGSTKPNPPVEPKR